MDHDTGRVVSYCRPLDHLSHFIRRVHSWRMDGPFHVYTILTLTILVCS